MTNPIQILKDFKDAAYMALRYGDTSIRTYFCAAAVSMFAAISVAVDSTTHAWKDPTLPNIGLALAEISATTFASRLLYKRFIKSLARLKPSKDTFFDPD